MITSAVHEAGGKICLQMLHAGRYAYHPGAGACRFGVWMGFETRFVWCLCCSPGAMPAPPPVLDWGSRVFHVFFWGGAGSDPKLCGGVQGKGSIDRTIDQLL